jgi:hypothetical protein
VIGRGIAFVVIGIILLFFLPWVGIPIGIVGLVLVILWLAGWSGREEVAKEPERPPALSLRRAAVSR